MAFTPAVVFDDVTFTWPDGSVALSHVSGAFSTGRTGLVGRNGSGKSTLLKLAAGELRPTTGHVTASGTVATLRQSLTLDTDRPVADLLGIADVLAAVRAVESGDVAEQHFDTIGDDWDVEARAHAALADAGLPPDALERRVAHLSGGEAMLVAIAGLRLRGADITLLDEPTNNLDRDARSRLGGMVRSWPGSLIVVSHDVELLELMDSTAELYENTLSVFGGPYSQWRAWLDTEQEAAKAAERTAANAVRVQKRERIEADEKLATRAQMGKKAQREKRVPLIVAHGRKMKAEVSAGKHRGEMRAREDDARAALDAAERRVREDDAIRIDLPDPSVAAGRRIATLGDGEREWILQGPERTALVGPNGAGKSTLLNQLLTGEGAPWRPAFTAEAHTDRIGHLAQRLDGLDENASAEENVRAAAPHVPDRELRNRLARFLIRGDAMRRPVRSLSGGERFRVALARMLLSEPPAQLLVLDEPTNNLDLDTVDQLVDALSQYRGAILVTSHDATFLDRLGIDLTLALDADGTLTEVPREMTS
ncbi:ABC-F family ATP-binding cassette domain-containing protein [Microbacterium gorillae]|uniref:ABC-F family ATP-binding cassette domain-containing protein n=1 Tax=Microbacterium gorillae TaxID=1231063 RepID=UPI00058BBA46|nr:ATP-binding cassette domain-containing protein [Microbacterium gorillae]